MEVVTDELGQEGEQGWAGTEEEGGDPQSS